MQINCGAVENILRDMSLVPTLVSEQDICLIFIPLIPFFGFDIHCALLPNLMHEVELGGWKALFIHLLRILESLDKHLLIELDWRYGGFTALCTICSNRLYSGIVRCQLLGGIQ